MALSVNCFRIVQGSSETTFISVSTGYKGEINPSRGWLLMVLFLTTTLNNGHHFSPLEKSTPHKLMASIFDIYSGNLFKQPTNYFKTCTVWLDLQDTDIINLPCREEDKAKLKSYVISLCRIWVAIEVSQSMKLFFDNSSSLLQLHSLSQKDKSA